MKFLLDVVVPLLVVFIMTLVGLNLRPEDFLRVRRYPVLVPGIVVGQWIVLIIVAGLLGRFLGLPSAVASGALMFAAAPIAALSNYYTQLARGSLALAVTLAAVSNALAAVLTPLAATIGFGLFLGESATIDLPFIKVAQQTVLGLLLPLLVGMFVRHRAAKWTLRWHVRLEYLGMLAITAVLGFVVVDQFVAIRNRFAMYFGASVLFTLAMLATGLLVSHVVTRTAEDRRALLWGFPARNVAVAALIATAAVGEVAAASFLAVLFATQVAILVPFALWLGRRAGKQRPIARPA